MLRGQPRLEGRGAGACMLCGASAWLLASAGENLLSEGEQKQLEGVGSEPGCSLSAQRLCEELVVWQSSVCGKLGSGPWGSDCMQQVCTKCIVCAGAHAKTTKGSRQQDALLDLSWGAASCLAVPLRQMEGAVLGPSRGPAFWQDPPSRGMLVRSECSRAQSWSLFLLLAVSLCSTHVWLHRCCFTLVWHSSCSYNLSWLPKTDLSPWF